MALATDSSGCQAGPVHHCAELLHELLAPCMVSCCLCISHNILGCTQHAERHCQLVVHLAQRHVSENAWPSVPCSVVQPCERDCSLLLVQ